MVSSTPRTPSFLSLTNWPLILIIIIIRFMKGYSFSETENETMGGNQTLLSGLREALQNLSLINNIQNRKNNSAVLLLLLIKKL